MRPQLEGSAPSWQPYCSFTTSQSTWWTCFSLQGNSRRRPREPSSKTPRANTLKCASLWSASSQPTRSIRAVRRSMGRTWRTIWSVFGSSRMQTIPSLRTCPSSASFCFSIHSLKVNRPVHNSRTKLSASCALIWSTRTWCFTTAAMAMRTSVRLSPSLWTRVRTLRNIQAVKLVSQTTLSNL